MSGRSEFASVALGLGMIAGVVLLLWQAIAGIGRWLSTLQSDVAAATVAASATVLVGVLGVLLSQWFTKGREIAEAHRAKKVELYRSFIQVMLKHLKEAKDRTGDSGDLTPNEEVVDFFRGFAGDLMLWGSPEVVRRFQRFRTLSARGNEDVLLAVDDLLRAMRSDLGNRTWTLPRGSLIKILLTDPERLDEVLAKRKAKK